MSPELTKQLLDLCRKWHSKASDARANARKISSAKNKPPEVVRMNYAGLEWVTLTHVDLSELKEQFSISDSLDECANDLSDLVYQITQSQSNP